MSISLTEVPFLVLQETLYTSNDFCVWRLLKRMFYAGSVSYFGDNGALPNYRIALPTTDSRRTVVSY